jgi:hypothetical protein
MPRVIGMCPMLVAACVRLGRRGRWGRGLQRATCRLANIVSGMSAIYAVLVHFMRSVVGLPMMFVLCVGHMR